MKKFAGYPVLAEAVNGFGDTCLLLDCEGIAQLEVLVKDGAAPTDAEIEAVVRSARTITEDPETAAALARSNPPLKPAAWVKQMEAVGRAP